MAGHLIKKNLKKFNTKFISVDSEHFSIWSLIENRKNNNLENVIQSVFVILVISIKIIYKYLGHKSAKTSKLVYG